ncbi:MAG: Rap1a/Tai family immunity protein [Alphaproteobacteria bacterium]
MFRKIGLGVAFSAVLIPSDARAADSIDLDQLESICLVTRDDHDASRRFRKCEKLIAHIREKLRVGDIHEIRACIPENVSSVYLVIVGMAWLEKNPIPRDQEAHASLARAYSQRWPCS